MESAQARDWRARVRAARRAAARLEAADLRRAAALAWRLNALREAARCPSRLKARLTARARLTDGRDRRRAARIALFALRLVLALALLGAGSFTPARRALERPIAIACLLERAPCSPLRTCSISSRTYSPACVDGAFPRRLARAARRRVCFSGIISSNLGPAGGSNAGAMFDH
jgi:hypothetical protein